jgi:hypothetical protein
MTKSETSSIKFSEATNCVRPTMNQLHIISFFMQSPVLSRPLLSLSQTTKRAIKRKHFTALQRKEMQAGNGAWKTIVILNRIYIKYISCMLKTRDSS